MAKVKSEMKAAVEGVAKG
jgi:translation elongation factor EF-4